MNNGDHPTLADAQALLPDAVLLPIDSGTKKPLRSRWQKNYIRRHSETRLSATLVQCWHHWSTAGRAEQLAG
jgi:hypothetical protein